MADTAKTIESIRHNFFTRLNAKTGWGRNEVKAQFEAAIHDSLQANESLAHDLQPPIEWPEFADES